MRILIVEDEARLASFMQRGLSAEGHRCEVVGDAASGLRQGAGPDFDLILLDRMLPGGDGLQICRQLREQGVQTPILMLTALAEVDERVDGLRAGADDYLGKPFDFEELLARVEALGRRTRGAADGEVLVHGRLKMDLKRHAVFKDDQEIVLTAQEFELLQLLMREPERFWSRERILNRVWGALADPETNVVDVYISRLRRKLDDPEAPSTIETRRGVGYRLRS